MCDAEGLVNPKLAQTMVKKAQGRVSACSVLPVFGHAHGGVKSWPGKPGRVFRLAVTWLSGLDLKHAQVMASASPSTNPRYQNQGHGVYASFGHTHPWLDQSMDPETEGRAIAADTS